MKLERDMWDALDEICRREALTVHQVCTMVAAKHRGNNLTAAMRVFILAYFRAAATEHGHARAGHGDDSQSEDSEPAGAPPALVRTRLFKRAY